MEEVPVHIEPHLSDPTRRSPARSRRNQRRLAKWLAFPALALGAATVGQVAGADPSNGVGPLTVSDNGHWFEYAGNGEPYFMAGSGGPEGFLYFSDTRKQAIVDQLINNDVRAIYIHAVRSNGGDGNGNENPFNNSSDPTSGVDPAVLDEWDTYLSQLDDAGIVTWFHLYDDGARPFGACNPDLPDAEQDFVQTIVERFRDYDHLVWLPTEEHQIKACSDNQTDIDKAEALAAEIRIHDDVHPLGVHHNNGQSNQYLGNDDIDVFAQQICQQSGSTSVDGTHNAGEFGQDVYVMAECHPWHKDLLNNGDRTTLRQSFWSSAMAGGYVLFYDAWESNDPTDAMLGDLGRINAFMDDTRFSETEPADELAAAGTKWVLANESEDIYIMYSNENPSTMGVQGASAGSYDLMWFNPVSGQRISQTVSVNAGTATFDVPDALGDEVALSVEPADGTPPVTDPPVTDPPVTDPPVTDPPATDPPVTDPPVTDPPTDISRLAPSGDAYLEGATRINNGQLRVESGARSRVSYLQFDTSALDDADTVQLELVVGDDAGQGTLTVSQGQGGSWTEDTLTSNNAPAAGDVIASIDGSFSIGQKVVFDLPASVVSGDALDLIVEIDGANGNDVAFVSTEGSAGPVLVLDGSDTPTPTVPAPTVPEPTVPGPTVPSNPTVATPVDDAYLQGATSMDNGLLRVESGNRSRVSFLRFDLRGAVTANTPMTLELTVASDAGSGTLEVLQGLDGSWSEGTLSAANAPASGPKVGGVSGDFAIGDLIAIPVTSDLVGADGVIEFVVTIDGAAANDVAFGSAESSLSPRLIIG